MHFHSDAIPKHGLLHIQVLEMKWIFALEPSSTNLPKQPRTKHAHTHLRTHSPSLSLSLSLSLTHTHTHTHTHLHTHTWNTHVHKHLRSYIHTHYTSHTTAVTTKDSGWSVLHHITIASPHALTIFPASAILNSRGRSSLSSGTKWPSTVTCTGSK